MASKLREVIELHEALKVWESEFLEIHRKYFKPEMATVALRCKTCPYFGTNFDNVFKYSCFEAFVYSKLVEKRNLRHFLDHVKASNKRKAKRER